MAAPMKNGVPFVGVPIVRALFGAYVKAPDFWKLQI